MSHMTSTSNACYDIAQFRKLLFIILVSLNVKNMYLLLKKNYTFVEV